MHDRTPIFRSLAMIEERIQEKLTVEALAEGIHFSKYHYQRMFREAVGDSVMGYVARRKAALAAEELADTNRTVLEVALRYGYDSHEGFTRSFKAHMGVTPAEYRKHCLYIRPRKMEKEGIAMMYSKTTEEIIRELNSLIVEARETAEDTRRNGGTGQAAEFYGKFWDFTADRAEEMAGQLKETLERVTALAQCPDGITARFQIVKAMEDTAFAASVMAFQTGLMIARAGREHREAYRSLCQRYSLLAEHARMKTGIVAAFLQELAGLIFQDMRQNARRRMEAAARAGREVAEKLSDPALPYGYIAEGIAEIADRLSDMPLEEVTASQLEDFQFRLDTIAFAARMDILRQPAHEVLFDGISEFRDRLNDLTCFTQSLWEGIAGASLEAKETSLQGRSKKKLYADLSMQEGILLFWLKGEIQKLGTIPEDPQRAALVAVCDKMARAVRLSGSREALAREEEILRLLQAAYEELAAQAEELGEYGGALAYIAQEVKGPFKYLGG